jgi:hypothetical protein
VTRMIPTRRPRRKLPSSRLNSEICSDRRGGRASVRRRIVGGEVTMPRRGAKRVPKRSAGSQTNSLTSVAQSSGHASPWVEERCKPFREDPARASSRLTATCSNAYDPLNLATCRRHIGNMADGRSASRLTDMATRWAHRSGRWSDETQRQNGAGDGRFANLSSVGKSEQRRAIHPHLPVLPKGFSICRTYILRDLFHPATHL